MNSTAIPQSHSAPISAILLPVFFFPPTLILVLLALSFASLIALALYRIFFSPLSSLPGPWYAAISDLWIVTHIVRLQQCRTVQSLFEKYGPVVRIGPNKVAFRDITSMRSVYCVQKFDKSTYYKSFLTYVLFLPFTPSHTYSFPCRNNNDHA